ncbi:SRPBCC family protein [Hoyosella sp. YIM 151337]|uniref:SRPBCC family protein n=1 Tax=Hoyosella sp. YIM 151337 TaxID=2992742 RepID=UPI002235D6E5|nr:SRPBCC family protein [Hoyosella sp. YIM 151337]MCW4354245.1 SRPBCC family protein [Hoyosella sp. YIM 151337]
MPVTSVTRDTEKLTMTVVAEFTAPVERLWNAYLDPRQLERFWGPPTYPAQFVRHDAAPGGRSVYSMTGPEGDTHHGYWEWLTVHPLHSFEVRDGFAASDGTPNADMPSMRMVYTFEPTGNGSRVTTVTHFNSLDDLEKLLDMGMEEGLQEAMGQMDEVLADLTSFARELPTSAQILSDTQVRISRVIRGTTEDVWRAHNDADLLRRWLLGPDGWTMPVCEVAANVGDSYRYEWEQADTSEGRFGFEGELLESVPPYRAVTTERMIGMEGEGTINEMTLTPVDGGTLLTIVITYPSAEVRDIVLGTGMTDGMETSYQRLEREVLAAAHA